MMDSDPPEPLEPIFSHYRRRLPHWRLTGATYFVTWDLYPTQPGLTPRERDRVVSALRHFDGDRYELFSFVVMNDHVHALVKPFDGHPLEKVLRSWKSFTATELQRSEGRVGKVWQAESFDRIMRNEDEFWEKAQYILENPARRWPGIEGYAWVWLREGGLEG